MEEVKSEKKVKRRRKRLVLLLLLLLMTGVILTTSSYAWFTANETVTVQTITVNVTAQNGIQLSADGTTWKSIVQTTDLTGVHATTYTSSVNQIPSTLEPVSTVGNIDANGKMEMFYGTVTTNSDGNYILSASRSLETESNGETSTGKFVAFDLFFKAEQGVNLYLTTNSGVTAEGDDTGIKNATRIGFVVLGNTTVGDSVANIQGLNAGTTAPKYIWEPNYDVHTAAGVANARDVYGLTTAEGAGNDQLAYKGVNAEITADNNVLLSATDTATNYFGDVTVDYATISGFSTYQQVFSLSAGITKVRVYMWIEGQDVDCENIASGGKVNYDLQFSINDGTGA